MTLPGYELGEQLPSSTGSAVYRAVRFADGVSVIIKRVRGTAASPRQFTRYQNEYQLLRLVDSGGVVKAHDLIRADGLPALVLEDAGGMSVKALAAEAGLGLRERLEIAVQIARALEAVHCAGIIHKDLNPSNVVYSAKTARCKLIDFGIATRLRSAESQFAVPRAIEGTLAYIAPEQTGRMNRAVDYRADLYSLGVTLYELFTGRLPHTGTDPLELVHFHIAGKPQAPAERDPRVPAVLSDIVMRLMSKAPEDRYQSAAGAAADLDVCLAALRAGTRVERFALARKDVVHNFDPPHKLYGREAEAAALLAAFERSADGAVESVLLSGPPGIGKTALVQELHEPVARRRGYIAAGKFDQLQRNVPFSALFAALQGLVEQLLSESDEAIAAWRDAIQAALGANAQIIVQAIPAVELIIGPQAAVPELDPVEARNRFNLVFRSFIRVFCDSAHPLVLFLDDMQWSDPATLDLLTVILTTHDTEALLVVQAYRNAETAPNHEFSLALEEQRNRGVAATAIELAPLALADATRFVADALRRECAATEALAETVLAKTGGNPFFMRQFLQALHAEGLIRFDAESGAFECDMTAIDAASITENVAELLARKLERLPAPTCEALKLAAAVGDRFDLDVLALIEGRSLAATAAHLEPALREGLVLPLTELESLEPDALEPRLGYRRYGFLHDRVRQAAYGRIPESERPALHLAIGRMLLPRVGERGLDQSLFDVVNHLSRGLGLISEADEKRRVADANLLAGHKARRSTAYALAAGCFAAAIELEGERGWTERHELAMGAHIKLAECLALTGRFAEAFAVIEDALARSRSDSDRAALQALKTSVHLSAGDMPAALACGRRAAKLVNVHLPEAPDEIERMLEADIDSILERTAKDGIEGLLTLPVMEDREKIAAMALLTHCLPAAYQSDQQLFALICCKMVKLSIDYGNCPLSARAYGSFAALVSSVLHAYRDAHRFAKLGVDLCHRFEDFSVLSAAYFLWANFASHWNRPVDESIELFRLSVQHGVQSGDHQHAGYSAARRISHLQFRGAPLAELRADTAAALEFLHRIGDATNGDFLRPRIVFMDWLMGERREDGRLGFDGLDEADATEIIKARGNKSFELDWFMLLEMQRYLRGDFRAGYELGCEAQALLPYGAGFITRAEHALFHSLCMVRLYPAAPADERGRLMEELTEHRRQLGLWAEHCPENYRHFHLLLEAELAALAGDVLGAMDLYDRAAAAASEQAFVNIEALAAELAAAFWFGQKRPAFGQIYLEKSLAAYEVWGATGKAADLRAEYAGRLGQAGSAQASTSTSGASAAAAESADTLDLASVLKASQAISQEIVLERLLGVMMDIILATAGAESGALVLESNGRLLVQSSRDEPSGRASILAGTPLERADDVAVGIVKYVLRTREHVVLAEPAAQGKFRGDRYVRERRPLSVLCAPIVHKGELTGALYLENNQVAGAFTAGRLEALRILLGQVAVSIENARLYARQEQQTRDIERANVELMREVAERERAEEEISRYKDHLEELVGARTRELESAQSRLVELSRRAGMAEVASGVLHNVGNVMNSVNVGATMARDTARALKVDGLARVGELLEAHRADLGAYLSSDAAGRKIPEYLKALGRTLAEDKAGLLERIEHTLEHLEHMKKIISAQQSYARSNGVMEICSLAEIVETAIAINESVLRRSDIEIVRDFADLPPMSVDRHQIMQIVVNLISNSKHALLASDRPDRVIRVSIAAEQRGARIEVEDNGIGIPAENMTKIFSHGFTTKKNGHGFGLHNCANGARRMNGSLTARSDGVGRGAVFTLRFAAEAAPESSAEAAPEPGGEAAAEPGVEAAVQTAGRRIGLG
jgi:predicted ATPase/signal transduction histidine kinase